MRRPGYLSPPRSGGESMNVSANRGHVACGSLHVSPPRQPAIWLFVSDSNVSITGFGRSPARASIDILDVPKMRLLSNALRTDEMAGYPISAASTPSG